MQSRFYFPIGILYVAAYLLKAGYEVEIIDCIGDNLSRVQCNERIIKSKANTFGIGGLIMAFNNVVEISYMIRNAYPDVLIFAGNTVASTIPEILINNSAVQIVVMWEGEYTTVNLMNAYKNKKSFETVNGIAFNNENGKFIKTPDQPVIKNLDELTFPAWDLISMKKYLDFNRSYFPISTVRGCPYNCTFCCKTFLLNKVRARSPKHIMDELIEAKKRYNIKIFAPFDDLFVYNKKRVLEFCDLKMKTPEIRDLPWECSARVNLLSEDLVKKMAKAKCIWIGVGLESGDQDILNGYRKGITIEQQHKAIKLLKKYNIEVNLGSSYLIGAINETYKTIKKSAKFAKKHGIKYTPHYVTPYPGTVLYKYALDKGLIKDELKFIKKISRIGNTNFLVVNLTENLSDKKLIRLKEKFTYVPIEKIYYPLKKLIKRIPFLVKLWFTKGPIKALRTLYGWYRYKPPFILEKYSNEWF